MKKLFITIAFVAAAMFAQAQFYVGGGLGFGTKSGSRTVEVTGSPSETTDLPKTMNFKIAPELGFMFTENMGIGLQVSYDYLKETNKTVDMTTGSPIETTTTEKNGKLGFKPYFRYVFAEVDNFKFYADAFVYYRTGKPTTTTETTGQPTVTSDGNKTVNLDFGIQPGMAYMLTDNISMNCKINLLTIAYKTTKVTNETTVGSVTSKATTKNNEFGFGLNEDSDIEIGFFYTF